MTVIRDAAQGAGEIKATDILNLDDWEADGGAGTHQRRREQVRRVCHGISKGVRIRHGEIEVCAYPCRSVGTDAATTPRNHAETPEGHDQQQFFKQPTNGGGCKSEQGFRTLKLLINPVTGKLYVGTDGVNAAP